LRPLFLTLYHCSKTATSGLVFRYQDRPRRPSGIFTLLDALTANSVACSGFLCPKNRTPVKTSAGWETGSNRRIDLAQAQEHDILDPGE
jgi:hypothetical protein